MSKPLNLGHVRTFVSVVQHGSFSAAAQRLDITQPAVSLQIRQLEKRLGTRLIERVGRRAQPTAAGAELMPHAEQIDTTRGTDLVVQPLSPRLHRTLAVVIRRDKRLHAGLSDLVRALKTLAKERPPH